MHARTAAHRRKLVLATTAALVLGTSAVHAGTVVTTLGSINAIYGDNEAFGGNAAGYYNDGLGFSFTNTSGTALTNATFSLSDTSYGDSFTIGTIAAGATVFVTPGVSSDGQLGHRFFGQFGGPLDTSDIGFGQLSNNVPFTFTADYGFKSISVSFTPLSTVKTSEDGSQTVNFLGNSPYGDGCNQCFAPGQIAPITITTNTTPTPEPASMLLFGCAVGVAGLAAGRRRKA